MYYKALSKKIKDVAGVDIEFAQPTNPDLIIKNDEGKEKLLSFAPMLANKIIGEN